VPPESPPVWRIDTLARASSYGSWILGCAQQSCWQLGQQNNDPMSMWAGNALGDFMRVWSALLDSASEILFRETLGVALELPHPPSQGSKPSAAAALLDWQQAHQRELGELQKAWARQLRDLLPRIGLRALEGVPESVLALVAQPEAPPNVAPQTFNRSLSSVVPRPVLEQLLRSAAALRHVRDSAHTYAETEYEDQLEIALRLANPDTRPPAKPLEEWQWHIRHWHQQWKAHSWCGAELDANELAFADLDHAVTSRLLGQRVLPCPWCALAVSITLERQGRCESCEMFGGHAPGCQASSVEPPPEPEDPPPRYELRYVAYDRLENRDPSRPVKVELEGADDDGQAIADAQHHAEQLVPERSAGGQLYPHGFEIVRVLDWSFELSPEARRTRLEHES
jgi:hypothetical protein